MKKAKHIEAYYTQTLQFDIEELDINWEDVKDYWVKWGTLFIQLSNDEIITLDDATECEIDWKWPNATSVLDKDFYEIEYHNEL
jgi:hypothetical protein|tara:strand:+ start:171 stop:422 length:252 start_codon:yes stop_codon:yes gene_type:complete